MIYFFRPRLQATGFFTWSRQSTSYTHAGAVHTLVSPVVVKTIWKKAAAAATEAVFWPSQKPTQKLMKQGKEKSGSWPIFIWKVVWDTAY